MQVFVRLHIRGIFCFSYNRPQPNIRPPIARSPGDLSRSARRLNFSLLNTGQHECTRWSIEARNLAYYSPAQAGLLASREKRSSRRLRKEELLCERIMLPGCGGWGINYGGCVFRITHWCIVSWPLCSPSLSLFQLLGSGRNRTMQIHRETEKSSRQASDYQFAEGFLLC